MKMKRETMVEEPARLTGCPHADLPHADPPIRFSLAALNAER